MLSDCSSNLALRTCAKHGCFNTAKRTSAHQCSVIAPAILHTHLCSAWLFQHSQTHKGRCSAWLLLHSQTHLLSSLSILHHTPKFSMGVQNFEGNDFHFGLITPSDPHLPCATGRDRAGISSRVKRTSRPPTLPCCIGRTYHSRTAPSLSRKRSHVRVKLTLIKLTIRVQVDHKYRSS